jgi:hypothetical protein
MAGCQGKRQFRRRSEAIKLMRSRAIPKKSGVKAEVYRCKLCGWYHIGHDFYRAGVARSAELRRMEANSDLGLVRGLLEMLDEKQS